MKEQEKANNPFAPEVAKEVWNKMSVAKRNKWLLAVGLYDERKRFYNQHKVWSLLPVGIRERLIIKARGNPHDPQECEHIPCSKCAGHDPHMTEHGIAGEALGGWIFEEKFRSGEEVLARDMAEDYRKAGIKTKVVQGNDKLWRVFREGGKRFMLGNPARKNPSTEGLTIVGACCILIETTRGRVSGKMGRVLGLPDGSVLIEGNFPRVPGGVVKVIEYMDDAKARAEGEGEGGIPWRHEMESERIALERAQGGLLLRRKNMPLWEMR